MMLGATLLMTMVLISECHVLFSTSSFLVNKEVKFKSTSRKGRIDVSKCQFPFIYKGVTYLECTTTDDPDGKLWCSTKTDHQNNHIKGNYAPCSSPDNEQLINKADKSNCKFPFIHKSVRYTECTTTDDPDGKLWCSTKTDNNNNHIKGNWEHCVQEPPYCKFPFIYKGTSYSKCITTDDPDGRLWCSTNTDAQNNHLKGPSNWNYCEGRKFSVPSVIPTEDDGCGIGLSNFIVGGSIADPHEFPWLAAIGSKVGTEFTQLCGGTLITKQHVISAAHCFTKGFPHIIVRLGKHNLYESEDGSIDFQIADTRGINSYNGFTKENDIILIKLDSQLNSFTDTIRPACLPYHLQHKIFKEETLVAVGWGVFDNNRNSSTSPVVMKGTVQGVPLQECQKIYKQYRPHWVIDKRQLCAGTGSTDSCQGDSGGPINYLDLKKERSYVVGVVSVGPTPCGDSKHPGVYTRITNFLDWIEANIKEMH